MGAVTGKDHLMVSEYLTMRLCLAETAWIEALAKFRTHKSKNKLDQLKQIDLLAWEIERLKEGKI